MTEPDLEGYSVWYDSYGQVTSRTVVTDLANSETVQTTYVYDSNGNLETIKPNNDVNLATTLDYDALGNVTMVTDADARETEFFYDYSGCGSCGGGLGQLVKVIDPLNKETHYEYDANGNMTKVTLDAGVGGLQRSTSYEYDANNRLVKIVSPTGSANEMTFAYDKLGRLTQRTSFEGVTTSYTYDHMGRVTDVYDSVGTFIAYTYDSMGKVLTVEDGEGNITSYTYDTQFRLTEVTDDEGKEVHYTYDTDGRVTEVGAGTTGTFDRTVYTYNTTTGLLSQVTYHSGSSSHSANYFYDDAARVVKLTDWIDGTNGIQYEYDALGRLDTVRDYDGSELTYTYDDVGNIASMTDYHNNTINYTYTAREHPPLSPFEGGARGMSAPGSKVWTYTYNALGQPTQVDIPNGMHTAYSYDTRNRLTEIAHKDGATVKQSFGYTLDDDGTITRITHEDGSYWDYGYDGRNRLISADRKSASTSIVAEYDYTYDDADNMLTKIEPFEDDFEDANYTGWVVLNGTWSASSKALIKADNGWGNVAVLSDDADNEIRFDYRFTDISGSDMGQVVPRYLSGNDNLAILIAPGAIILYSTVSGTATTLDYQTFSTVEDQWYTLRVESDGANVKVWRSTEGELETEVLSTTSAAPTTTDAVLMGIVNTTMTNSPFELDNVRILADDLENSTTFAYNTANELTIHSGSVV